MDRPQFILRFTAGVVQLYCYPESLRLWLLGRCVEPRLGRKCTQESRHELRLTIEYELQRLIDIDLLWRHDIAGEAWQFNVAVVRAEGG